MNALENIAMSLRRVASGGCSAKTNSSAPIHTWNQSARGKHFGSLKLGILVLQFCELEETKFLKKAQNAIFETGWKSS